MSVDQKNSKNLGVYFSTHANLPHWGDGTGQVTHLPGETFPTFLMSLCPSDVVNYIVDFALLPEEGGAAPFCLPALDFPRLPALPKSLPSSRQHHLHSSAPYTERWPNTVRNLCSLNPTRSQCRCQCQMKSGQIIHRL